jgi:serine/threonine protein kinase
MEKFTKVKNIGKGNMGACALARNNEDGRYYVIKQVDLAKLNKKERQQSLNEAKVLSSLRHPNVINYVDSFLARKSDHLCIVMEFADGGDLSNKIKNNHGVNFPENMVLDWLIQMALSLHYVHQRKILHRDVKTQNVFLTQDGLCKLGDFGIARTLNSTYDQASTFVGTPYYLSPELILERPYDYMSDVWALGIVLYEMMALRHPFNANDMKSLMHRILKVQYDPLPTCYSGELRGIVAKILVKDPLQRMRLGELLEQTVVVRRMREWFDGGTMPTKYLQSLARVKMLPLSLSNLIAMSTGVDPAGHAAALPAIQRQSEDYTGKGLLAPRYEVDEQVNGRYGIDAKPARSTQMQPTQLQMLDKAGGMPRRDPSLIAMPSGNYYAPQPAVSPTQQQYGAMPRRDPGLVHPNLVSPQQPAQAPYQRVSIPNNNPVYRLQPIGGPPEMPNNQPGYQRSVVPTNSNAYNVPQTYYTAGGNQRVQPSIVPLNGSPPPGPPPQSVPTNRPMGGGVVPGAAGGGGPTLLPPPPKDAIQAMLQRAAQERAMRQQQQQQQMRY